AGRDQALTALVLDRLVADRGASDPLAGAHELARQLAGEVRTADAARAASDAAGDSPDASREHTEPAVDGSPGTTADHASLAADDSPGTPADHPDPVPGSSPGTAADHQDSPAAHPLPPDAASGPVRTGGLAAPMTAIAPAEVWFSGGSRTVGKDQPAQLAGPVRAWVDAAVAARNANEKLPPYQVTGWGNGGSLRGEGRARDTGKQRAEAVAAEFARQAEALLGTRPGGEAITPADVRAAARIRSGGSQLPENLVRPGIPAEDQRRRVLVEIPSAAVPARPGGTADWSRRGELSSRDLSRLGDVLDRLRAEDVPFAGTPGAVAAEFGIGEGDARRLLDAAIDRSRQEARARSEFPSRKAVAHRYRYHREPGTAVPPQPVRDRAASRAGLSLAAALALPAGSVVSADSFADPADAPRYFAVRHPGMERVNRDGHTENCLEASVQLSFSLLEGTAFVAGGSGKNLEVREVEQLASAKSADVSPARIEEHMRGQETGAAGLVFLGGDRRDGHYVLVRKDERGVVEYLDGQAATLPRLAGKSVVGFIPLTWTGTTELPAPQRLDPTLVGGEVPVADRLALHPVLNRWKNETGDGPVIAGTIPPQKSWWGMSKTPPEAIRFRAKDVWSQVVRNRNGLPAGVLFSNRGGGARVQGAWSSPEHDGSRYTWRALDKDDRPETFDRALPRSRAGLPGRVQAPGSGDYERHPLGPIHFFTHGSKEAHLSVTLPAGTQLVGGRRLAKDTEVAVSASGFAHVLDQSESFRTAFRTRPDSSLVATVCFAGSSGAGNALMRTLYRKLGYVNDAHFTVDSSAFEAEERLESSSAVGDHFPGGEGWWRTVSRGAKGFPESRIVEDTAYPEFARHALLSLQARDGYLGRQEDLRRELIEHPELRHAAGVNRDLLDQGARGHVRNGFNAMLAAAQSIKDGVTVPALPGGPVSVGQAEKVLGGELISAPLEEIERHLSRPEQPAGAQGAVLFDGQWLVAHKTSDGKVHFVDGHRGQFADRRTGLGRDEQGNPVHGPSGFMPLPGSGALPLGNQRLDPTLRGGADDGAALALRPGPSSEAPVAVAEGAAVPVLGVVPVWEDAGQRQAWEVLIADSGVRSAGELADRLAGVGLVLRPEQVREVVVGYARWTAGWAAEPAREVLAAAAGRYEEVAGDGAAEGEVRDLGAEPVFRRWAAGRLGSAAPGWGEAGE
ncbi:hypothetical protein, partial [Amycolatopsis sp. NPDC000740]